MRFILLLLFILLASTVQGQFRDSVYVKTKIYEVVYSELLQQPKWLVYRSTNRPTKVNRGTIDFHLETKIKTSDDADYYANEWDKGHLAPAATFSDNMENLYITFSYLNSALQQQDLNRGAWRLLEQQERIWDDKEPLTVKILLEFKNSRILSTGATIPSAFHKHIFWEVSKKKECYYFPNAKPILTWDQYRKASCPLLKF
jgi:DNA/RNA endonuclease G (NUC1)